MDSGESGSKRNDITLSMVHLRHQIRDRVLSPWRILDGHGFIGQPAASPESTHPKEIFTVKVRLVAACRVARLTPRLV